MSGTFGATGEYVDRTAVRKAIDRLIRAGFRRGSIDTWPRDGAFLVPLRTGEHDHDDAVRALTSRRTGLFNLEGSTGSPFADRLLPLGLAALAGLVLFGVAKRR